MNLAHGYIITRSHFALDQERITITGTMTMTITSTCRDHGRSYALSRGAASRA
jgi:hypothetical protein